MQLIIKPRLKSEAQVSPAKSLDMLFVMCVVFYISFPLDFFLLFVIRYFCCRLLESSANIWCWGMGGGAGPYRAIITHPARGIPAMAAKARLDKNMFGFNEMKCSVTLQLNLQRVTLRTVSRYFWHRLWTGHSIQINWNRRLNPRILANYWRAGFEVAGLMAWRVAPIWISPMIDSIGTGQSIRSEWHVAACGRLSPFSEVMVGLNWIDTEEGVAITDCGWAGLAVVRVAAQCLAPGAPPPRTLLAYFCKNKRKNRNELTINHTLRLETWVHVTAITMGASRLDFDVSPAGLCGDGMLHLTGWNPTR